MKDKQWYVDQHRAMWNWIADQIEEKKTALSIHNLKREWCEYYKISLRHDCFSCEYDSEHGGNVCEYCLFDWGVDTDSCSHEDGSYSCEDGCYGECRLLCYDNLWEEQAALARKIANLPVREEV